MIIVFYETIKIIEQSFAPEEYKKVVNGCGGAKYRGGWNIYPWRGFSVFYVILLILI